MREASRKLTFAIPVPLTEAGLPTFLASALNVAAKDVRTELRSRQAAGGSLVFALLTVVIFNFAFDLEGEMKDIAAPGILWVAIVLAGMMAFGHVFAQEREQGGLEGLLLTPVDPGAVFLGKAPLFSATAAPSRSRELLLPLLLLPVATPVLIAAVEGTRSALGGEPVGELLPGLRVVGGVGQQGPG